MRLARLYAILWAVLAILEGGGMNTRKQFLRDGFGLAAILYAQSAPAILVRSMVAARNGIMVAAKGLSAKSYVQNGLVAMWDGEWNAGGGVHDPNATVWKDLIGNRDWTLGTSTSYEWTASSFDAKDQFAATQDFIDGSLVTTVEVCVKLKTPSVWVNGNFAFIIIGRILGSPGPYYGLLYRNAQNVLALMGSLSYFAGTVSEFAGVPASFSFPNYATVGVSGYFDGISRDASGYNTLDYNATTRGTVARIGGTAQQPMPIEVYNIRLYSRALTAAEIAANYAVDKQRFNLT